MVLLTFLTAALMWFLLAMRCTMKTKVLLSSISFMADSVVRGYWMILKQSILQGKNKINQTCLDCNNAFHANTNQVSGYYTTELTVSYEMPLNINFTIKNVMSQYLQMKLSIISKQLHTLAFLGLTFWGT